MAERSGMTERGFHRRFKKATGQAPGDYIQTLRIEEAKQLLETTATPIDEVAAEVGYSEPSSFRSAFRKRVGISASAYRKKWQALAPARTPEDDALCNSSLNRASSRTSSAMSAVTEFALGLAASVDLPEAILPHRMRRVALSAGIDEVSLNSVPYLARRERTKCSKSFVQRGLAPFPNSIHYGNRSSLCRPPTKARGILRPTALQARSRLDHGSE
jgi:hypothetical protein